MGRRTIDVKLVCQIKIDCKGVCGGGDESYIVKDIDGNSYITVKIGEQIWMAENLKTSHYQNGDPITHITNKNNWGSYDEGQYGVYDNNPLNADTYGNLW